MFTETNDLGMKEYSALHNFFNTINYTSQATQWNHFEVSTHVPTYQILDAKSSLVYINPNFEDP